MNRKQHQALHAPLHAPLDAPLHDAQPAPASSAVELTDDALDQASGGLVVNAIIAVLFSPLLPSVQKDGLTPDQARQVAAGNPLPRPR